ncbi:hypothetical protein [Amycolatopsis magusensis]|uniref:hypothetical protein n=1 Tax=Amycolatopsis magusensis TaxID=882444 RepID=UPI0024A8565C|nr:hypothetical protein [Amycolatopsis magusensis]MDI5979029.1 hypothetical protein [Amycolatopsis magusensis]
MTGSRAVLEPGEETVAQACIRARQLGERLNTRLIDRELCWELQRFLELAFRACDALERLARRPETELRHRLDLVLGLVQPEDEGR